ncbi:MAG: ATP-binding protein, partial [Bacteroidota bacterium]
MLNIDETALVPVNCKIVLLCRPERTHLLNPSDSIRRITLLPFTEEETFENLQKSYAKVSAQEASEFHRLTNGNPRVQMNAITAGHSSVSGLLTYLGPFGTTVEKQIEQQLFAAVQNVKEILPRDYQARVDKICIGLASLPPNIPIQVLSEASQVDVGTIRSFVADIGRSLWLLDSSVQFRDEPTETWFRDTFLGSKEVFESYTTTLEPLANDFVYVAQVLPLLYLQAGQYDRLINIALSDHLLPSDNPIDSRNVLVYRLQFAFKAALRSQKYTDAIKLALRAGEEVAGDRRQQDLFRENIDLLAQLQDRLKVQEIAFTGRLESSWEGSENVFTASLLSEVEEYKGEANGYLRSAMNWLGIYFQEDQKQEDR